MNTNITIYNTGDIVFPDADPSIDPDKEPGISAVVVHMWYEDDGWHADKTPGEVWDICNHDAALVYLRDANGFIYHLERVDSRRVWFVHIEYNGDEATEPCRFVRMYADQLTGEWHSTND